MGRPISLDRHQRRKRDGSDWGVQAFQHRLDSENGRELRTRSMQRAITHLEPGDGQSAPNARLNPPGG
ncbi:MAG: hypothetical protein JWO31_2433 [Phycisphaerales bacterium]|nr:hypothetical protein [Phycisphaerales bacterium]